MTPSFVQFHRYGSNEAVMVNPALVEAVEDAIGGSMIWIGGSKFHVREHIDLVVVQLEAS